ncbi:MAG: hypothetical protein ACR2JC_01485 [Chloroflexota bacterium]|nr:MAG: hypothetical protein DLM70_19465 [Chloroflexota bacterium]
MRESWRDRFVNHKPSVKETEPTVTKGAILAGGKTPDEAPVAPKDANGQDVRQSVEDRNDS